MKPPVLDYMSPERARETVEALRNEAYSADALRDYDRAARLRIHASDLERSILAVRTFVYRPSLAEVRIDSDPQDLARKSGALS